MGLLRVRADSFLHAVASPFPSFVTTEKCRKVQKIEEVRRTLQFVANVTGTLQCCLGHTARLLSQPSGAGFYESNVQSPGCAHTLHLSLLRIACRPSALGTSARCAGKQ